MECNKDEAFRAKEIAEKKMTEKDMAGAKKFALKAQNLFPGLDGLSQLMAALEVYISAETKLDGEIDWYSVLGVNSLADDETLRKQYRKLALNLHPDKNKSVGAEGAFQIVSEAWSLLSDKAKRTAYDHKRNLQVFQKVSNGNPSMPASKNGNSSMPAGMSGNPPMPARKNGFHTSTNNKNVGNTYPTHAPHASKPNTFWTACNKCSIQYQYLKYYLNQTLICPKCRGPFLAVEMRGPPIHHQNANHHFGNSSILGRKFNPVSNVGTLGFSGVDSINSLNVQQSPLSRPESSAAHVVQQTIENLKRGREEVKEGVVGEEGIRRKANVSKKTGSGIKGERILKKRRTDEHKVCSNGKEFENRMEMGNGGAFRGNVSGYQKGSSGTRKANTSGGNKQNGIKELSQMEIRNMLIEKSRMEIRKRLDEWNVKASHKEGREMEKETPNTSVNGVTIDGNKNAQFVNIKKEIHPNKSSPTISSVGSDTKAAEIMSMSVPDPDFHDFDKDRTEKSFSENQVWAAYDDDDGMPRYYALIHSVISRRPFKVRISWLNSKSNSELGQLNWVSSGFSKICGDFRIGKHEVNNTLNSFSHKVKWEKGTKGIIQIFPRKGDVWALYRNWSSDWTELTPDEVIHKYEMVEVLEDYNEEKGISVIPLVKVAGFKSVFHQHLDPREVRKIPREEIFRFSHQVISYMLTGQEARKAPKGCLELDPAAMPLELLRVITEANEVEVVENAGKFINDNVSEGVEKAKELNSGENDKMTEEKRMTKFINENVSEGVGKAKELNSGENDKTTEEKRMTIEKIYVRKKKRIKEEKTMADTNISNQ